MNHKLSISMMCVVALAGVARAQQASQDAPAVRAEMRSDASVVGVEVRLRQVLRWAKADASFFAPVADVVVGRFQPNQRSLKLNIDAVLRTLEGAGMNRGELLVSGSTIVDVTRLDVDSPAARHEVDHPKKVEKDLSLDEFLGQAANQPAGQPAGPSANQPVGQRAGSPEASPSPTTQPVAPFGTAAAAAATPVFNVRESIYQEAMRRTGATRDELELTFEQGSERVLQLAEPAYKWTVAPGRYRGRSGLGQCSWYVTLTAGEESKRVEVSATVRRWQTQVVAKGGIAAGEIIREGDVEEKRVLVERPPDEMLLSLETARTMEACQPISGGTVLTGRMVRRVMLVRRGQLVSIVITEGSFQVRSVARAGEDGYYGSVIKVENQETKQIFSVTVTGQQEASLGGEAPGVVPVAEGSK